MTALALITAFSSVPAIQEADRQLGTYRFAEHPDCLFKSGEEDFQQKDGGECRNKVEQCYFLDGCELDTEKMRNEVFEYSLNRTGVDLKTIRTPEYIVPQSQRVGGVLPI